MHGSRRAIFGQNMGWLCCAFGSSVDFSQNGACLGLSRVRTVLVIKIGTAVNKREDPSSSNCKHKPQTTHRQDQYGTQYGGLWFG